MTWLAIFRMALSLALSLADTVREKRLLDAGAKAEIGRTLALLMHRTQTMDEVGTAIEAMTDDDLDAALRGDR